MSTITCVWLLLASGPTPAAPGAATQPQDACVACHENLPGRLSAVVVEWRESIHHANSVMCDSCHGGDPSVRREQFDSDEAFKRRSHLRRYGQIFGLQPSSGRFIASVRGRNISYFCGKCHTNIMEKHLGSPHGGLGAPSCLYCHGGGSHAIGDPTIDIIDPRPRSEQGRCATCHRAATMETVATIKKALASTETLLANAVEQYAWLEAHGYKNLALEKLYHHSKETVSQLRQTFHSFNMREINNFASAIKANAELTQQTHDMIEKLERARKRQAFTGAMAVLFLLLFVALLQYYRRSVLRHD